MEQGPTTTSKRESSWRKMRWIVARLSTTVRLHASVIGISAFNFRGVSSRVVSRTFKSWVENIARVYGVLWHLPKIISGPDKRSKLAPQWQRHCLKKEPPG